jgi:KpsF/GutQ family protein
MIECEPLWQTALHVWQVGARSLGALSETIDPTAFRRCVEVLAGCRGRIVTSGAGTSGVAARKIAHSLSCIERPSFFLCPADAVHGALGAVQTGDAAILISKGGWTREILAMLPALKTKRIFRIAVTEKEDSPLARASDLVMMVKVEREADEFDMLATTSTMAVVAVFDAVCIALMKATGFSKEQFAIIHPGGAVGERLQKES